MRSCAILALGVALMLQPLAGGADSALASTLRVTQELPFNQLPLADLRASPRKVFAHWHWFPTSFDNAQPASDYYATQYLRPEGEGGKYAGNGGYIRERPLGRDPIDDLAWQRVDMQREVLRAGAAGLDGFTFNILNPDRASMQWALFTTMLDAAETVDPGFKIVPNIDASAIPASSLAAVIDSDRKSVV